MEQGLVIKLKGMKGTLVNLIDANKGKVFGRIRN